MFPKEIGRRDRQALVLPIPSGWMIGEKTIAKDRIIPMTIRRKRRRVKIRIMIITNNNDNDNSHNNDNDDDSTDDNSI